MWRAFLLLLLNFPKFSWSKANFVPIVSVELSQSGFHRDVLYNVQFDYPLAGKDCEYALEQQFPAAIYVSVDQLNDLKRLRKLNSIYPEFVDIEATAEKSTPFTVILKGMVKISDNIKLPIHYRYHAPNDENSFVEVELTPPQLYIKCHGSDDELIDNEILLTPHIRHCLEDDKVLFSTRDEHKSGMDCNWRAMKVEYQIKTTLIAKIPIGNSKSFPIVLYATIICSWAISLWTVFHTRSVPRNINQKLEQQRLINKKDN